MADIEAAEKDKMRQKCEKIVAHGINCFVNRQVWGSFTYCRAALGAANSCLLLHTARLARL